MIVTDNAMQTERLNMEARAAQNRRLRKLEEMVEQLETENAALQGRLNAIEDLLRQMYELAKAA